METWFETFKILKQYLHIDSTNFLPCHQLILKEDMIANYLNLDPDF